MEGRAAMVAHIHRGVDGQQEEADPVFVAAFEQVRVRAQDHREGFAVAELVIAPLFEPFEDRVEAEFRMLFQLAEDRDVARVADLLGEIDRVPDVFRLEERVLLLARQEAQIDADAEILEHEIDETGMPGLVARHQAEQGFHVGIFDLPRDLAVEHAARELGRQ